MALVHKLKGDNRTFSELSDLLIINALNICPSSSRIDVVFDVYKDNSIKNEERIRRGMDSGILFSKIVPTHRIKNWQRLLSMPGSKEKLIQFFAEDWQKKQNHLADKELFVTCGKKCTKISKENIEDVQVLMSTQEEADTRMILHAKHAAESGFKSVTLVAEDTDVLILCVAFCSEIKCEMYMRCGRLNRKRLISITNLADTLGNDICKSILGYHAFSGCDTVSSFSGQGKIKGFKLMQRSKMFQDAFRAIGEHWNLTSEVFEDIQDFTCKLYASRTTTSTVNQLRYQLWRAKKGAVESGQLPPCKDSLYQHTLRANYQSAIWKRSLLSNMQAPLPQNNHGWVLGEAGTLDIKWMSGKPAPESILEFISCTCLRKCEVSSCPCILNRLKCTAECKLQDCENMVLDDEYLEMLSEDSESDSD